MRASFYWMKAGFVGAVLTAAVGATGCSAEVVAEPAYYPPPAFVAATAPVYYEGRPAYWYNNRWYFRSGAGWGYYRSEPRYLYRQRTVYGPPAHAYVRVR